MIDAVYDTNVVISGMLWSGAPRQVFRAAEVGRVNGHVSEVMLDELRDVLARQKFAQRLKMTGKTVSALVDEYLQFARIVQPPELVPVVRSDPDHDHVIACAVAAQASYIVTGDPHLLNLSRFDHIGIVNVTTFLELLEKNL